MLITKISYECGALYQKKNGPVWPQEVYKCGLAIGLFKRTCHATTTEPAGPSTTNFVAIDGPARVSMAAMHRWSGQTIYGTIGCPFLPRMFPSLNCYCLTSNALFTPSCHDPE